MSSNRGCFCFCFGGELSLWLCEGVMGRCKSVKMLYQVVLIGSDEGC